MEPDERTTAGEARSVRACPACGRHTLALEQPPHIPVAGAQPYTEIYRMGDLPMPVGVRCRSCGRWWETVEALEAGDPGSAEPIDPVDGLGTPSLEPAAGPGGVQAWPVGAVASVIVAIGVGIVLLVFGFLELAFIAVGSILLAGRLLRRRS
jgi:hypothetical protein